MISEKIQSLLRVSELGSISEAARSLSLTQPAVSQHIKALEKELGVKLFDRAHGRISITKQGETAVRCAKRILVLYENLLRDLSAKGAQADHIRVGFTHTAESNPVAEALAKFGAENRDITITIHTDKIKNLYSKLHSYELDLAVTEGRVEDPSLRYMLLDTDYLALAVPPQHPFAKRELVNLKELQREKLILRLPGSNTRKQLDRFLQSSRLNLADLNIALEIDNVATIKDLVRREFGISILPRSACLDEAKKKKIVLVPVENLSIVRETNLAYLEDFDRPDILADISRCYTEIIQSYN
ncbi:MAG: LysR family transcriptional regulator [Lachnospiraceae bacterium]|nr:LysR family transcriptional regulator [Lachnospiraceae bacterium]